MLSTGDDSSGSGETAPPATSSGGESSGKDLLTIEEDVNNLKERVFRAKATLQLLSEVVAQGAAGASRANVTHENRLSRRYQLETVTYYLNGQKAYGSAETGMLSQKGEIRVFDGPLTPGQHTLSLTVQMRGNGLGIFSYVDDYTFTLNSTYQFSAEQGQSCAVHVKLDEQRGVGRSFTERPGVNYETKCVAMGDGG